MDPLDRRAFLTMDAAGLTMPVWMAQPTLRSHRRTLWPGTDGPPRGGNDE